MDTKQILQMESGGKWVEEEDSSSPWRNESMNKLSRPANAVRLDTNICIIFRTF